MAARIRKIRHDDETRAKIQTSQLLNRLNDYAFGEVELEPGQVNAIKILLGKTLPDLSAVELSGDEDNPVAIKGIGWLTKPELSAYPITPEPSSSTSTTENSAL